MENKTNINWYPGHMTKAKRMMQESLPLVDLIIEVVDARLPLSSRNPDIDELGKNKLRIVLLNKADLADPLMNKYWIEYFKNKNIWCMEINSKTGNGVKNVHSLINEACREKKERDKKRGILNRPIRAMVVGIPNVGKSTFINSFVGKNSAKTGNKPGVTKGKQWIRVNKELELLDTPGILWPKLENQLAARYLAFIGSINDLIIVLDELACDLIDTIKDEYSQSFVDRYGIEVKEKAYDTLLEIAKSRKCYLKGQELDTMKASGILLEDFRSGKLGRITLDKSQTE